MRIRDGIVLLEVMIALAILAITGGALLSMAAEGSVAVERSRHLDGQFRAADDFMGVVSLWSAEDLDRRLGTRRQGVWSLTIQRPEPGLYSIALLDSTARHVMLATELYRPARSR